jgi:hypothetical protein
MTTVAFVWSDFKSDEAFLEHMKKTMAENGDQPLKHVRVAYDNKQRDPNRLPNDGAAAWLKYLDENVIAEHAATIETLAFDIEFSVNLMGYPSYPGCFRFAMGGSAAFKAFNHLMGTMRELSQRENVDVTICGIKRRDMQFVVVDEIPNPSPPPTSEPKPKPTTQVYGHRLNAKTGQIEAVMGVSDDAKWTHFETTTTETEYVVSMGELPENVPIQVVVDADGKSVRIKNEDYDSTKRPTTWVGRTFLVPHDAIASTISAERSPGNNSISVRIQRGSAIDAAVPSDLWPVNNDGKLRKIPIVENEA